MRRLGEYDEAEKRLANAFPTQRASANGSHQDADDNACSAREIVGALEETQPINLAGLRQWYSQLEKSLQSTGDVPMSSGDFLQVPEPLQRPTAWSHARQYPDSAHCTLPLVDACMPHSSGVNSLVIGSRMEQLHASCMHQVSNCLQVSE